MVFCSWVRDDLGVLPAYAGIILLLILINKRSKLINVLLV